MSEEEVKVVAVEEAGAAEKVRGKNGGRNLALLGLFAVVIAVVASAISLAIYHATGDVYLDRSRPGFISEGEKSNDSEEREKTYVFSADGAVTEEVLDEYLEELDKVGGEILDGADGFSPAALSDEALGIDE